MKSKKAWLRIVEAFIAIILIASVLLVLYSRIAGRENSSEEIYKFQESILDEIASDSLLRKDILRGEDSNVRNFIKIRIPPGFEFDVKICEVGKICQLDYYKEDVEIYAVERIISSDIQVLEFSPKKIKIFMWRV